MGITWAGGVSASTTAASNSAARGPTASTSSAVGSATGAPTASAARGKLPFSLHHHERRRVLRAANQYLHEPPITLTAYKSVRSAGGPHDYFSEGDYWWPDPANPDGPFIRRDGMTNPDNFVEHRRALFRMCIQVPALA